MNDDTRLMTMDDDTHVDGDDYTFERMPRRLPALSAEGAEYLALHRGADGGCDCWSCRGRRAVIEYIQELERAVRRG